MEAKDVSLIVRACGKAGVSRLKYGELEIDFTEKPKTYAMVNGVLTELPEVATEPTVSAPIAHPEHPDAAVIAEQANENDEIQASFEHEARELIEDPEAFEQRLIEEAVRGAS